MSLGTLNFLDLRLRLRNYKTLGFEIGNGRNHRLENGFQSAATSAFFSSFCSYNFSSHATTNNMHRTSTLQLEIRNLSDLDQIEIHQILITLKSVRLGGMPANIYQSGNICGNLDHKNISEYVTFQNSIVENLANVKVVKHAK